MSQAKAALERFSNCDPHQGGAAIQGGVKSGAVVTLNTGDTPAFGDSCVLLTLLQRRELALQNGIVVL